MTELFIRTIGVIRQFCVSYILCFFQCAFLLGFVCPARASGGGHEPTSSHALAIAEGWLVPEKISGLQVLLPNEVVYGEAVPKKSYPEGTQFFLRRGSQALTLIHSSGISVELAPGSLWLANSKQLEQSRRHQRMAVDVLEIPQSPEKSAEVVQKTIENLLGFFVPRIPQELSELPKEPKARNVIKIIFPGQVHGLDTPVLPAVVRFEWELGKGQKEPHALYIWPEGASSGSPLMVVKGGQASVPIPKFGRYFWQVEDATGRYLSAPRTIVVRPLAAPLEKTASQTAPELGKGSFRLLFPDQNTNVVGCLNGQKPLVFPLKIPVTQEKIFSYRVEVSPRNGWEADEVFVPLGSRVALGQIRFWQPGSYRIRAVAKHNQEEKSHAGARLEDVSDYSLVQVSKICEDDGVAETVAANPDLKGAPDLLEKLFTTLNKGRGFPARGALVFE